MKVQQTHEAADGTQKSANTMSSPTSPTSPHTTSATSSIATDRPRLSEQEKKNNHITSEQKRRAAIREQFDRLTDLVPGLEGQGRSEGLVLTKVVEFARKKLEEKRLLEEEVEARGGTVDREYKK